MPLILLDGRKEEKKARLSTQQRAGFEDERALALQKTLQEKQKERQRLRQSESTKKNVSVMVSTHNVKSWKAKQVTMKSISMCSSSPCSCTRWAVELLLRCFKCIVPLKALHDQFLILTMMTAFPGKARGRRTLGRSGEQLRASDTESQGNSQDVDMCFILQQADQVECKILEIY